METTAINGTSNWIGYKGPDDFKIKKDDDVSLWEQARVPLAMTEEQKEEFEASLEKYRSENRKTLPPPSFIGILPLYDIDIDFKQEEDFDSRKWLLM